MRAEVVQPGLRVRNTRTGREGVVVEVKGGDVANMRVYIDYDLTGRSDAIGVRPDCLVPAVR